ncbi:hypothetical protein FA95DRAFT_1532196 [Auriscalpium vulgare]|uniref:Uncharacterized protein n=1 Tax=Auriscalpium vulgare TaxID=40419 RepID=A0ACB8SAM8_9AGAM|nr:hypothetical protein FA95DRAFT_1532196 [Auriscalpium vulgare]
MRRRRPAISHLSPSPFVACIESVPMVDNSALTLPDVRRVVTGHTGDGAATIQSDTAITSMVEPGFPGVKTVPLWTVEGMPGNDNNLKLDGTSREIPASTLGLVLPNGANFRFTDLAPGSSTPLHRTSSVDLNILISGELVAITEDGSERCLSTPGDTLINQGTMHAWRNPGKTWTRWATVLVDAAPVVINGQSLGVAVKP